MRLAIGLFLALLINFGLFSVMQKMTSSEGIERKSVEQVQILDFVRLKREERVDVKKRALPKKPPPPKKAPPPPQAQAPKVNKPKAPPPKMTVPQVNVPLNIAGAAYLGGVAVAPAVTPAASSSESVSPSLEKDVMPLVRIPPKYPRSASRRRIEGVVTVSFTITKEGTVKNPVVVKASPANIFDKASLKAILKWKFKPKVVNGQAVERQAVQNIEFKLPK